MGAPSGALSPRLGLLGPVELRDTQGVSVPLGGPKQCAVLAWLALQSPHASSVDQIVHALWGDSAPSTARNAVHVYVSRLRRALLPFDADIRREGAGYQFIKGALVVDAAEFEQLVAAGRIALRSEEPLRAVELLTKASAIWRGVPFSGLESSPFAETSRSQLESSLSAARLDLADSLLRAGRADEAIAAVTSLLEITPYDERIWSVLVMAHYRAGRQAEALNTCRRVRTLLAEELGLDPGPDLVQLEQQILDHEVPGTQTSAKPMAPVPPESGPEIRRLPSLPRPMIGRADLVTSICSTIDDGARLLTLVGLGGIGKTCLALAVAHQLRAAGVAVAFCELETATDPIIALERVCRDIGIDPFGDPVAALRMVSAETCHVVILDNTEQIQELGGSLKSVLDGNDQLVIVTTSRMALRIQWEQLISVPPLVTESSGGNSGSAVQLFLAHAGRVRPDLDTAESMSSITTMCQLLEGLPLAISLMAQRLRVLTPKQLLARTERATSSLLDVSGPRDAPLRQHSLRVVLAGTIPMLTESSRRLLESAAVLDGWAPSELLETISKTDDFVESLDELVVAGLVQLDERGRVRIRVPVRDYVRSSGKNPEIEGNFIGEMVALATTFTSRLHGPGTDDALAEMDDLQDAMTSAVTKAVSTDSEAAGHLVLALNRYWLLSGRLVEARRWAETVAELSGLTPATKVRVKLMAGIFASYVSHPDAAATLTEAVRQADEIALTPDWMLVNAWCCRGASLVLRSDFEEALVCVRRAIELAQSSGDKLTIGLARDFSGYVAKYVGDLDTAYDVVLAGITDARHAGDRYDLVLLLTEAAEVLVQLQRLDDAWTMMEEAFELSRLFPVGALWARVLIVRSTVLIMQRRHSAGRGHLVELLRLTQERHLDPPMVADALILLGCIPSIDGDHHGAAKLWGAADALYRDNGVDDPSLRHSEIVALQRARSAEALGSQAYDLGLALGSADPARVVQLAMES